MNVIEIIFSPTGGTEKAAHIISRHIIIIDVTLKTWLFHDSKYWHNGSNIQYIKSSIMPANAILVGIDVYFVICIGIFE